MKKWFIILAIFIALVTALASIVGKYKDLNRKYEVSMANIKEYNRQLSGETEQNIALRFTVDQLKNYQDSIVRKLDETRNELKIKDKKIQSLQYVESEFTKTDTILMRDTIFKEPSFALDTLIGDSWYNVQLGFKYPSTVAIKPYFRSEKHIIVSTQKETINPPKKFFLLRWFQKKHTVLKVDVIEKNPYIDKGTSKYIEIVK